MKGRAGNMMKMSLPKGVRYKLVLLLRTNQEGEASDRV